MARLLGIDVGTSAVKAVVIDELGRRIAQASATIPISSPQPLWSEQDPEEWWRATQTCLAELGWTEYDAIGLSGQMHGAVCVDGKGVPVAPALLWNDQRTEAECAEIEKICGARFRTITCNAPVTGLQLPKLLWLRKHQPEAFGRIRNVVLPKDFVRWKLTGQWMSDVSDAGGTGLFDVPARRWSEELFAAFELDPDWFPPALESFERSGETHGESGLAPGIPVVAGGGDQACGGVGSGVVAPGSMSLALGTSGVVFTANDRAEFDSTGALNTFGHANGRWLTMGVSLNCGDVIRTFRDQLAPGASFADFDRLAASAPAGSEGLVLLPYLQGERCPFAAASAPFGLVGTQTNREAACRAALEGVTANLALAKRLIDARSTPAEAVRVNGGGAKSVLWRQIIADLFGVPVLTLESEEGPAVGAALLGGVGAGLFSSVEEACQRSIRTSGETLPRGEEGQRVMEQFIEACVARNVPLPISVL